MGSNKVFWARLGQQIVARVKNSLKSRRLRSFEGYHDQLGADDVIPEEAHKLSERASFGKVVLNEPRYYCWAQLASKIESWQGCFASIAEIQYR